MPNNGIRRYNLDQVFTVSTTYIYRLAIFYIAYIILPLNSEIRENP